MANYQEFGIGFSSNALLLDGCAKPAKRKSNDTSMIMQPKCTSAIIIRVPAFPAIGNVLPQFTCFTTFIC